MYGFNINEDGESFSHYLDQIFNEYIERVPIFSRNIAIIDGENLLGYYVDPSGQLMQIECGKSMYAPIFEVLEASKAINKDTFIVITQKRNNDLCAVKELELIKGNPSVYIFVIEDNDVVININGKQVNLNVVKSITGKSFNLPKNHYIKGFDDFIGYYIFTYLYQLSKEPFKSVNSVFYYSGDIFKDYNSYIAPLPYVLAPSDRSRFNGETEIQFDGFHKINVYSAKNNQIYQLVNTQSVRFTLTKSENEYSRETIKAEDICKYFEVNSPDKTIRICRNTANLQIHILGNPSNTETILQEIKHVFNLPLHSYSLPTITEPTNTNFLSMDQWSHNLPEKFNFKPINGTDDFMVYESTNYQPNEFMNDPMIYEPTQKSQAELDAIVSNRFISNPKQVGGFYKKYLKYKTKYLKLKE